MSTCEACGCCPRCEREMKIEKEHEELLSALKALIRITRRLDQNREYYRARNLIKQIEAGQS